MKSGKYRDREGNIHLPGDTFEWDSARGDMKDVKPSLDIKCELLSGDPEAPVGPVTDIRVEIRNGYFYGFNIETGQALNAKGFRRQQAVNTFGERPVAAAEQE
jgi:hypothetical protein